LGDGFLMRQGYTLVWEAARKTLGVDAVLPRFVASATRIEQTSQRIVPGMVSRTELARKAKQIRWIRAALLDALTRLPERAPIAEALETEILNGN